MTHSSRSDFLQTNYIEFDEHDVAVGAMAFEQARQGAGQAIIVAGESGIGKTTYVSRFLSRLDPEQSRIFHVEDFEHDAGIPYAPWMRFIQSDPELTARCPRPIGSANPVAQNTTELMTRTVKGLVEFSAEYPTVIIIDNLESADEPTRELLLGLARRIERSSILLMVVVETPIAETSPIRQFTPALLRDAPAHFLELSPVSDRQVYQLIENEMIAGNVEDRSRVADEIVKLANGNRLYLQELLPHLHQTAARSPEIPADYVQRLPATLEQIIAFRLAELSKESLQTLQIAALIGDTVDFDLLVDVIGDDPELTLDHLEEALTLGLLKELPNYETRFSHGVIRQAMRQNVSQLRQRQIHRKILSQLASRSNVRSSLVALHAEQAGDAKAAYTALVQAGQEAQQVFALREAGGFYERALSVSQAAEIDDQQQDELRLKFANCFFYYNWDHAEREIGLVLARANAREDRQTQAIARYHQAVVLYEIGELKAAKDILTDVIPTLESGKNLTMLADGLRYYGFCCSTLADFDELHNVAERLLQLNETLDNPIYRAIALHFQAHSMVARGVEVERARTVGRESMEILAVVGRLESAAAFAWVIFHSVDVPSNLHRPNEILKLIERGRFVDQEGDRLLGISDTGCTLPFCYYNFLQGDWDEVRKRIPDPANSRDERWTQTQKDIIHIIGAELANAEGRYSDAVDLLRYIAPSPEHAHRNHSYRQWVIAVELHICICLKHGQLTQAQLWIAAMSRALEEKPYFPGELVLGLCIARAQIADDRIDEALRTLKDVTQQAKSMSNMLALIEGRRLEADALLKIGDAEMALHQAAEAVEAAEQTELEYVTILARLTYVTALNNLPDRRAETREIALGLEERFKRLGASPAQTQVQRLYSRSRSENPGGITTREMDVLRLVLVGLTDQEIGSQLYISPRTVGTHISNMLNKTGASNRVELTTWAIANGISVDPSDLLRTF